MGSKILCLFWIIKKEIFSIIETTSYIYNYIYKNEADKNSSSTDVYRIFPAKPTININTDKRRNASNNLEKDLKLINGSMFGKRKKSLRNRVNVRLDMNTKHCQKLRSKPTFISQNIFNKILIAFHKIKQVIKLSKPAYMGIGILNFSSTLMDYFHYNYIKDKYCHEAKLLFTESNKFKFDFSKYQENLKFYDNSNKKVIGKMVN